MPTHPNGKDNSWRRKIARAEEHLFDFARRIAPLQERRAYPVSEGFEDYEGTRQNVRRVTLPHLDDPMLEILVGELMFNARSALDHLACALVPPEKRTPKVMKATQFPIFTVDIDDPANTKARDGWRRQTQGFPTAVAVAVKKVQPYAHPHPSLGAEHHSLALLRDLQNADKHRQLLIVVESLHDPIIRHTDATGAVTYESDAGGLAADHVLKNRGVIDFAPTNDLEHVRVEVEGTLAIMVGEGGRGPFKACPDVFELMLGNVAGICDELEPLITFVGVGVHL
jgi:hypothetical protein